MVPVKLLHFGQKGALVEKAEDLADVELDGVEEVLGVLEGGEGGDVRGVGDGGAGAPVEGIDGAGGEVGGAEGGSA